MLGTITLDVLIAIIEAKKDSVCEFIDGVVI